MCIAFDGAYILEAPPADPASNDDYRQPVSEMMPASAGGEGSGASALPSATSSFPSGSTALGKVGVPLS
jgi:hypothetical protein